MLRRNGSWLCAEILAYISVLYEERFLFFATLLMLFKFVWTVLSLSLQSKRCSPTTIQGLDSLTPGLLMYVFRMPK